jgi:glycosyltransferase involved in cell wall biosynthesis
LRLVFVNRFFHPDESATSQLLTDLCEHLAQAGHQVHVVTSRQLHGDAGARLQARETHMGVEVHRVRTTRFGRAKLAGRAFDYASFYAAATVRLLRLVRRGDVVIAKTDPPLISVAAAFVCRVKGARLVNWVQDLFPEVALQLGLRGLDGWAARIMTALRDRSLRVATVNIALGDRMAAKLRRHSGAAPVEVVHNWADGGAIRPCQGRDCALRAECGLGGRFVVGYSGNMGRAHEFDTILAACERLRDRDDVAFLFVGEGARRAHLEAQAARRDLRNIVFRPFQPRKRLAASLGAADAHLVTLRPGLEGLIVPSKFYGIAAAGRAVIFVGERRGEIGRLVESAGCGVVVEAGDVEALVAQIERLAADRVATESMGKRARVLFEACFDRPLALARWDALLARLQSAGMSVTDVTRRAR